MAHAFPQDNRRGDNYKDEWLTPLEIIKPLGEFDLDPCSPIIRPWSTAKQHFTINDDGLRQEWSGRVWLNPPFGNQATKWIEKLANHGNGIALLAARTETKMFQRYVWSMAQGILFLYGRPHFHHVDGSRARANSGVPICLIAYGTYNVEALRSSGLEGHLFEINSWDNTGW